MNYSTPKKFSYFFRLYHRIRSWQPIWNYLNRVSREEWNLYFREHLLDTIQKRVAADLKKDGIALVHISEFFPKEELFPALAQYANSLFMSPVAQEKIKEAEEGRIATKSDLIIHLLGGYTGITPKLVFSDPFIKFILHERILQIVGDYFSSVSKFIMFSLHSTILRRQSSKEKFSQRWHRDPDDKKIIKVFLYMNEVTDSGAGPFIYVKGSQYGGRWRALSPQRPPVGSYPHEGMVEKNVPPEDILVCRGRPGTMIFCDTSGLHKGGYSTTLRRLMFAGTFVTSASIQPQNFVIEDEKGKDDLPLLARMSLEKIIGNIKTP